MRYVPTSTATVEALKKQAKKLHRKGGGKHVELLDRVARGAGYYHWHHVKLCLKVFEAKRGLEALNAECDLIVRAAQEGKSKIVITGPETLTVPLVLFSSQGDAWMLDADEGLAMCLVWGGETQEREIDDAGNGTEIGWDGPYALDGDAFTVETNHPAIGTRRIHAYPLDELRQAIAKSRSFDKRFGALFEQEDAVDLTPELIERLIAQGWDQSVIAQTAGNGARYKPEPEQPAFSADA